ncbi:helix-turn-helix domain-containing protein [Paenibacillus sp. ACRRY]|uniref:helix-turn-helix domain-containing protein n=1 Tax=Paenibacillus sp. ACRRY TaxID=2918208 RepID=UPI001EF4D6F8|nr:helix-turn-helix domain-containing protein [Paenibacillus sp. ACRRY]MCG7381226.1 helix-turn-helix domain-containing protein [Paenibacillus sp. ACRRY]
MQMTSLYIQLKQFTLLDLSLPPKTEKRCTPTEMGDADCCTLLISLDRGVRLHTNGIAQDLRQGGCIMLPPQQSYSLETTREQAKVFRFTFLTFEVKELALHPVACPPLIPGCSYNLPVSTLKLALASEEWAASRPLQGHNQEHEQGSRHRKSSTKPGTALSILQARLQLVLGMMAQLEQAPPASVSDEQSVERTISYMTQHYNEDLTVELLAEMAGMVRWKYSKLFKAIAGKKPTDYLAELRVNQAKLLLASSTEPLREISRQVGYKDEYYFSRRFQQLTGCPPREYANKQLRKRQRTITDALGRQVHLPEEATRIVATGTNTLGELLAIGISPVGAGIATMKSQVMYKNKLHRIIDIGLQAVPDQVSQLNPDLMLLGNYCEQHLPHLDAIAPTIVYRDTNYSTYEGLRYIADLFNRGKAAEQWIERYENGVRRVRRHLAGQYIVGEHATVYLRLGQKVYVMGRTGFAATLYESLGFRPSVQVHQLIEDGKPWIQIKPNEISHYTGERNFVLVSQQELRLASPHPLLSVLTTLTPGKVHVVESGWNYDDPITRERLLKVLPSIFAKAELAAKLM